MSSNREIPQRVLIVEQDASSDITVEAPTTDSGQHFKYFDSVTSQLRGSAMSFYGGGIFEYVDIDAATLANVVKYINPDTGVPFVDLDDADGKAAGWYEKIETEPVSMIAAAGVPVYGRFTKLTVPSGTDIGTVVITYG
jgi:hypothetical protein